MLCPRCGKSVGDTVQLCSTCKMKELQQSGEGFGQTAATASPSVTAMHTPAGFWLRFFASFADIAIVSVITLGFDKLLSMVLKESFSGIVQKALGSGLPQSLSSSDSVFLASIFAGIVALLGLLLIQYLVWLLYFSIFEGSRLGATPGKLILGLKVTHVNGNRVSFLQALLRNLLKTLSALPLLLGFMIAGLTRRKQALHDILSGSLVQASDQMPGGIRFIGCVASVSLFVAWYAFFGDATHTKNKHASFVSFSKSKTKGASYSLSADSKRKNSSSIVITNENIDALSKERSLSGLVRGSTFLPDKVTFSKTVKTLTFRQGKEFFADKQITIFLFTDLKELPGKIFKVDRDSKKFGSPHVHVSAKVSGKNVPETEIFMNGYAMYLRIHGTSGTYLRGQIKLTVPGVKGGRLTGEFRAAME